MERKAHVFGEAMSASSRMAQEVDEATSESSWTLRQKRRKETGGALTWRVKWRSLRSKEVFLLPKADPWIPKGRWATGQLGPRQQKRKGEVEGR